MLRFKPAVAPIEVSVLPLMDRIELVAPAQKILAELRRRGMRVDYDTSGSIGRRYRRNDEAGTPYEVTVDYETLEQGTVTIRDGTPCSRSRFLSGRWQTSFRRCSTAYKVSGGRRPGWSCEKRVKVERARME